MQNSLNQIKKITVKSLTSRLEHTDERISGLIEKMEELKHLDNHKEKKTHNKLSRIYKSYWTTLKGQM